MSEQQAEYTTPFGEPLPEPPDELWALYYGYGGCNEYVAGLTKIYNGQVRYIRADLIPCTCADAYTKRGLTDPNCCYHNYVE